MSNKPFPVSPSAASEHAALPLHRVSPLTPFRAPHQNKIAPPDQFLGVSDHTLATAHSFDQDCFVFKSA